MSPGWTIVTEQAFNVANDRHCCRSPRFTHGWLLRVANSMECRCIPFLPCTRTLRHRRNTDSSSTHIHTHGRFKFALVVPRAVFSFQHGVWLQGRGRIGHNEPVVSAYKRRTRPGLVWGEIYELCGIRRSHRREWLLWPVSRRRCAFSIVR